MISHAIAARFYDCQFQTADSALHETAHSGDVDSLRKLICQDTYKTQLNKRNHLGCTPLRLAATGGHVEATRTLLAAGASVDVSDVKGQTPLFVAVKNNHCECVRVLLQHGASTEGSEENVATPLYTAAMNGSSNMVKILIEYGANITNPKMRVTRPFSMDPLQIAVAYQQFECVRLLLLASISFQFDLRVTESLYHIAIKQKCSVRLLRLLFEFGLSVYRTDSQGKYPWQHDLSGYSENKRENILQYFCAVRDSPRSLKSLSRLCITRTMTRENKLKELDSLGLPQSLLTYLKFRDI